MTSNQRFRKDALPMGCAALSLVSLCAAATFCFAQARTPGSPAASYTLHVYEDLVQIPVLVLDRTRKSKPGLTVSDFFIRLDSGPTFHPRKMHIEDDDPLSVIFLLDAGSPRQAAFLQALEEHLADLPTTLFRTGDRLSVFAFDCKLVTTAQDRPASAALLQQAIEEAIDNPALHARKQQDCAHPVFLWDALSGAASLSDSTPGRRVMFVLSPGQDTQSIHTAEIARRYVTSLGVTVMGVREVDGLIGRREDLFALLCGETGGIDAYVTSYSIARSLPYLFDLLRQRYILEFPLPSNGTAGTHHLDVSLEDRTLIVRSGGNSTPLLDSSTFTNPALTPEAPPRPTLGTRRPLDPN